MSLALFLQNLLTACVQGFVITLAAIAVARLLPVERPRLGLAFWQGLLAVALVGPWMASDLVAPGRIDIVSRSAAPVFPATSSAVGGVTVAMVIALALGLGIVFRGVRLWVGLRRLQGYRRRAWALDPRHPALASVAEVGPGVACLVSDEVGGPGTFGLVRPAILLPRAFLGMPLERQRAVLAHERTHVGRCDWLANLLEEMVACLFWFHPAVPLLLGRVRLAREQRVDELVVQGTGRRQAYLEALLEMASHVVPGRSVPASLLLEEHHLRARVEQLLKEVRMSKTTALSRLGAWALAVAIVGASAAAALPVLVVAQAPDAHEKGAGESRPSKEPKLVHKVNPVYPEDAKKDKIEGLVLLEIRVGKDGAVTAVRVKSGHENLREAAVAAVRQWRYEPTLGPDGKPTEVALTITINFRLS
jgi:TonB family protein